MVSKKVTLISLVLMAMIISSALSPVASTVAERIGDVGDSVRSSSAAGLKASSDVKADFSPDVTCGIGSLTVSFMDRSVNAASWSWDLGDGNISNVRDPVHTYTVPGTYTVTLTVTSSFGTDAEVKADLITVHPLTGGIYSTALKNTNPGAPDPGIPGFVGPTGSYVNPLFVGWASVVVDYSPANQFIYNDGFATPYLALGPATGNVMHIVSLGDLTAAQIDAGERPGSVTLGFDVPIANGPGPDFAVFENGFISGGGAGEAGGLFAELGYAEVSTDGITFVRFPSVYMSAAVGGGYATVGPESIYNLVGKHANGYGQSWGTPFDLSDLVHTPEVLSGSVDLNNINFVRVVDIPGSGDFKDSLGNPIYDAWHTYGSGGVDLDAIGVINTAYPVAGFTADETSTEEMTVQFTDASSGSPLYWHWDFGDGTTSTEQNPSHAYTAPGTYIVTLTVADLVGSDARTYYITVAEA